MATESLVSPALENQGATPHGDDLLTMHDVTRVYPAHGGRPPFHALGPVSLRLRRGEFFSVVGPSGCGKSTLLDVVAGLSAPTEGTIVFEGQRVAGQVPEGVAVVFQEDATLPWLTVYDNAAFGAVETGVDPSQIRERVLHALAFTGLNAFAQAYPAQLSGGMRQRVCIARAMVMRPRLLLLDEPFGALDQQTRLLMGDELLKLWRQTGATIMLITHSIDEAIMLSDRVGIMSSRPGLFIDVLETGWHADRDSTIVSDPRFGDLNSQVWSKLRQEAMKAIGVQS